MRRIGAVVLCGLMLGACSDKPDINVASAISQVELLAGAVSIKGQIDIDSRS